MVVVNEPMLDLSTPPSTNLPSTSTVSCTCQTLLKPKFKTEEEKEVPPLYLPTQEIIDFNFRICVWQSDNLVSDPRFSYFFSEGASTPTVTGYEARQMVEFAISYFEEYLLPEPPPFGTPPVRPHPPTSIDPLIVEKLKELYKDNRYILRMLECGAYLRECYIAVRRLLFAMSPVYADKLENVFECYSYISEPDSFQDPFQLLLCIVYVGICNATQELIRKKCHLLNMADPTIARAQGNLTLYKAMEAAARGGRQILKIEPIRGLSEQAVHFAELTQIDFLSCLPGQEQCNHKKGSKSKSGALAQALPAAMLLAMGAALYLSRWMTIGDEAQVVREADRLAEGKEKEPPFRMQFF